MGRFTEKQLLLVTIGVSVLLCATFCVFMYLDIQAIYAAEITDESPEAAEITDEAQWGELRKIYEIKEEMKAYQAQADLIPKREQDVIVYREIVKRDSAILPDVTEVNRLVNTIGEFEKMSGVAVTQLSDLNVSRNAKGKAIRVMPIKLRLSGTFDQVLKFINLFENQDRIVNTRAFTISAGRPGPDGFDAAAIHDVRLDLETYIYTSNAGLAKPVMIANYERQKADPQIQKLIRQEKPAHVEKYQLKHRVNRRDPLVDPRVHRNDVGGTNIPGAEDFEEQKQLVDNIRFEVQLLQEDVRQEKEYIEEKKYIPAAQLKLIIDEKVAKLAGEIESIAKVITIGELVDVFQAEVVAPFEAIKSSRNIDIGPVVMGRAEVGKFHEDMRSKWESGQFSEVLKAWSAFDGMVRKRQVSEDALPLLDEMKDMRHQAEVMEEFAKIKLTISGLILRPNNGSIVIINRSSKRVGDYVDQAADLRLDGIQEDLLIFYFKGERIEYPLGDH